MTTPTQPTTPWESPVPPPFPNPGAPQHQPPRKSWPARHKVWTAILALGAIGVIGNVVTGGGTGPAPVAASITAKAPAAQPSYQAPETTTAPETTVAPKATKAPAPKTAEPPALTTSQEQAIGAAKDYLDYSGFSRLALIEQLSSSYGSGFSKADATFAVDYLKVSWKEQAVRVAKEYLASQHFSRSGLIQQLSSPYGSQFTRAQAIYAVDKVGL